MSKIIARYWILIVAALLLGMYFFGYQRMFFHQDDLDWFLLADRPFVQVMLAPIGDHINYLFRILLALEWSVFRLNFPLYLAISILMHAIVIGMLYQLVEITTLRKDLAIASAILFSINTNWTEIVLWISGQTISITVIFVLWGMICLFRKKRVYLSMFLAGLTSALALGLPIASLAVYGYIIKTKKLTVVGLASIGSLLLSVFIYLTKATDGTKIELGINWVLKVVVVWVLMIVNTVVGRLFLPFDRFEMTRIALSTVGILIVTYLLRKKIYEIVTDKWSLFLIVQIAIYYLVVAAGRAQYGIGIMRAERYAYLGFALIILLVARIARKTKVNPIMFVVPVVILQIFGFYHRANSYVVRPQQLKQLFNEVHANGFSGHKPEEYLPHFVLNDERLRYGDLMKLMKD